MNGNKTETSKFGANVEKESYLETIHILCKDVFRIFGRILTKVCIMYVMYNEGKSEWKQD